MTVVTSVTEVKLYFKKKVLRKMRVYQHLFSHKSLIKGRKNGRKVYVVRFLRERRGMKLKYISNTQVCGHLQQSVLYAPFLVF